MRIAIRDLSKRFGSLVVVERASFDIAEGELFTCLFAARGTDLRGPLRDGASDAELGALIRTVWGARDDRYSDLRSAGTASLPRVEMFAIGG